MANKRTKAQMIVKKKQEKVKKLDFLKVIAICLTAIVMALFFVDWAQIYNTTIQGKEVSFTGFNALLASINGTYRSPDAMYGDLAIPFFYYARDGVKTLCALTTANMIILVVLLIAQIIAVLKGKQILNLICAVLSLALTVMLFVAYGAAIKLNASQILPIYCSGNPACSIKSYIIVPAIISILIIACHAVPYILFEIAKTTKLK